MVGRKKYYTTGEEHNRKIVKNYMRLYETQGKLFDTFEANPIKRKMVKQDWGVH